MLSDVSSVYDPDGRGCAFIFPGKKVLQEVTAEKVDWDDPPSAHHIERWDKWKRDMQLLETLSTPRCYTPDGFGEIASQALHCFSDASSIGYGQTSYLRSINVSGDVHISLVTAKSRVAPLKKSVTIPRLELTAGTVNVKVAAMLNEELDIPDLPITYWTDSTIVLGYLLNTTKRFRTYVANRVSIINDYSENQQWRQVRSEDNPADFASRGLSPKCKEKVDMWFNGPSFLWKGEDEWPANITPSVDEDDVEVKCESITINKVAVSETLDTLTTLETNISSWYKLVRPR